MALDTNKLTAMFTGPPVPTEQACIDFMVPKWIAYFADAEVDGVTAVTAAVPMGEANLRDDLVGISAPDQGAAVMGLAITNWWTAAMGAAAAVWPGTPSGVIIGGAPPGGLSGIATTLQPKFIENTVNANDLPTSAAVLGPSISGAMAGGEVTIQPPSGPTITKPVT